MNDEARHERRQRLHHAAEHYLQGCFKKRSRPTAAGFAAFLGRNRTYLSRKTTDVEGMSLHEFLRQKQVDEAIRLMRTTPLSMDEIAVHAGFGSTNTFYRCFKRVYATPPGEYARSLRKR